MDHRSEIREFLTSRRARITPAQAGLPSHGIRRVPGLRRAEAAQLADVSVEYYARMERGNLTGVSDAVLDALARALRLDDAERAHLYDLARAAAPSPRRRRTPASQRGVRPNVQRLLDSMTDSPAFVVNGRTDVLAANSLGRALFAPLHTGAAQPPNHARFIFLDPRSHTFWDDWDHAADDAVALLHAQAGRAPFDQDLTALVGELSTRSEDFRIRWARHDVRRHTTGLKSLRHPAIGPLRLTFEAMTLVADTDLTLFVYGAEPGTPAEDGLRLLATWTATHDQQRATPVTGDA
ncbi:helix-turn-helix transcriptional regulator [Streptomyces sp. MBT62]|uniref:helix-turn-helix transcriptional regulator n=1 Tax=Streptomyces sp. MBT62 TaxID=2800410 RepID=UPI00190CF37C|nr:helix-turn-helix transcriptional regulator [Streptomyces sp. MBT62]MBK3568872.1 helix-turn-helix domain-containing protein [Streptomyces sp. MBT62]